MEKFLVQEKLKIIEVIGTQIKFRMKFSDFVFILYLNIICNIQKVFSLGIITILFLFLLFFKKRLS